MTKRYGNFNLQNNKKPKLDTDIDALWGDDLDEEVLEDCIKLATQVCEEDKISCTQLNNVTILPTYSAFKERNLIISSTQFTSSIQPSTSKYEPIRKKVNKKISVNADIDLHTELKVSRQQCEEKEGEVAVLRSQLQEVKTHNQIEQRKIQNDWKQKLNMTEKEMRTIKSELEFKDLEIANLKQKITHITKHNNNSDVTLNATHGTANNKNEKEPLTNVQSKRPTKIQAILYPVYPLKQIIPEFIFSIPKREQHIIETKLIHPCRNSIPYLQNQTVSATIAVDKSEINISSLYPEILKLTYCSVEELNCDENMFGVNKIICTCEQFLHDLHTFLEQIKSNLRTEDILEADSNYLKHQVSQCRVEDKHEIGLKAGVLLNFVSELLPYNDYLKKYICQRMDLHFQRKETYMKQFPYLVEKQQKFCQHYFLNLILNIVRTAGEIRKADILTSFFCATIKLLINIVKSGYFDYVCDIFCKLTKEIILSRPTVKVICEITFLFKVASLNLSFIEFLFNKSQNSISSRKGVLYFNEDACRFYVFVMLFDNSIFKLKSEYFSKSVCLNMLSFMYNTFQTSIWIHHRDAKECECVPQLYKLEIEIVFMALEKYMEEVKTKRKTDEWSHFFKDGIAVKILSLMTFNSYELTEKYITVFSQYKEIEKKLQEENICELDKLNISEEIVEIPSSVFGNINF